MADAFEDEGEGPPVTIDEYIEGIEAEELEADLVLGGDDGEECTYNSAGYAKRQAIFSCLTCVPGGNAGVCVACCLTCHDGHEIVELWTKRKFRCDCGNSKFAEFSCKLCPDKDPENFENSYNHNFRGVYCTCGRPYPDPDVKEQIEMIQCCICEDWFHEDHLGLNSMDKIPRDEEGEPLYEDFICHQCGVSCSFLRLYPASIWASLEKKNMPDLTHSKFDAQLHVSRASSASASNENGNLDSHILLNASMDESGCKRTLNSTSLEVVSPDNVTRAGNSAGVKDENANGYVDPHIVMNASNDASGCKSTLNESPSLLVGGTQDNQNMTVNSADASDKNSDCICKLGLDVSVALLRVENIGPMFLAKNWRQLLCRCQKCISFYTQRGVTFLIDKEDSIEEYEKIAKQKREHKLQQQEGAEANFFNSLNHVQKIEIASAVADMKNELASFLESRDPSKAVTSEDVRAIFDSLAKKRQRLS